MVVYKVIVTVAKEKADEWYIWMSDVHIPEVINTGHFVDYSFLRKLTSVDDNPNEVIFEIQYMCKGYYELEAYKKNDAERIREKNLTLYGNYIIKVERFDYVDLTIPDLIEELA